MNYRGLRELNDERGRFALRTEDLLLLASVTMFGMFILSFFDLELIGLIIGLAASVALVMARLRARPRIIRDYLISKIQLGRLK